MANASYERLAYFSSRCLIFRFSSSNESRTNATARRSWDEGKSKPHKPVLLHHQTWHHPNDHITDDRRLDNASCRIEFCGSFKEQVNYIVNFITPRGKRDLFELHNDDEIKHSAINRRVNDMTQSDSLCASTR